MEVFKPRFSIIGWLVSIGLVVFSFLLVWVSFHFAKNTSSIIASLVFSGVFVFATIFFSIIYPTMRYELREAELWLRCGPFRWRVPYSEIEEIVKTNIKYHPTSTGWKVPGYTIGKVYYADRGYIRMCASSMCKNIILIRTEKNLFGVTPKNEEKFMQALKARLS